MLKFVAFTWFLCLELIPIYNCALQNFQETEIAIKQQQTRYQLQRNEQRERFQSENDLDDDTFWKTPSENSPETRVEMARRSRRHQEKQDTVKEKKAPKLFNKDGRPLNINQAKVDFRFDDDPEKFVLDVAVYKYLDTSLIEVDVQPVFVKVVIKGKLFQFVLPEEVATDRSVAQRSQTTGHLVICMPKANFKVARKVVEKVKKAQFLEVGKPEKIDFGSIVLETNYSEIPPLEYC